MSITRECLHFILVPDNGAARRLRRIIASSGARIGLVIGTWQELVEYACNAYLVPPAKTQWDERFEEELRNFQDAFWSKSFDIAEEDTQGAIERVVCEFIGASDPKNYTNFNGIDGLQERPTKHLVELGRLLDAIGCLPPDYATLYALTNTSDQDSIRNILVYVEKDFPRLNRWQSLLVEKLNTEAKTAFDPLLQDQLKTIASPISIAQTTTSLFALQEKLFASPDHKQKLDGSIQWVGVRDFLSEAEVAAGMVQTILKEHPTYKPSDIGILLPDRYEYALAVRDTFALGGLPLSGLNLENWQRDLGREALFHFLYCRQKPAPAMALAVCLASFLMPWSRETGAQLAQRIMEGDYRLNDYWLANSDDKAMLSLIRGEGDDPQSLQQAIKEFISLLSKDEAVAHHVQQAKVASEQVIAMLEKQEEIDWVRLRRAITPKYIIQSDTPEYTQEGVTIWREGYEPWRTVHHLIVLGFSAGHYPASIRHSPVFEESDLEHLQAESELDLETPSQQLMRARNRLRRQLRAVMESVTYLVPRRNTSGESQMPSESLVFMQALFEGKNNRIFEIDSAVDRDRIAFLPRKPSEVSQPPRKIIVSDLQFNRNLLELVSDKQGYMKPVSPSSLETLMVSRLAWLLQRLDAEPASWAPERSNVILLGNLAHDVFEYLFQSGTTNIDRDTINSKVESFLDLAIEKHGPFLLAPQWQVERMHLSAEITKAALHWLEVLSQMNADVLGCEQWLQGKFHYIPVHGKADILLGLPNDHILIVDYKRSSASGRRARMEKGFDSQASLYRTMIETGGLKDQSNQAVSKRLANARHIGVVYYTLNDLTLLSDVQLQQTGSIGGWEAMTEDISSQAIHWIQQRLDEVSSGLIMLNREGDEEYFDKKAGVKPYALDRSPLIRLFTLAGDAQEAM